MKFDGHTTRLRGTCRVLEKGELWPLVGDSAGGNLCYCLAMQLLHHMGTEAHVPALALISPWINCGNDAYDRLLKEDSYKHDILSLQYIQRSRVNYFGPSGYPPNSASVKVGAKLKTTLPASCINPWLSRLDCPLVKELPSIYCVAGTREMLVEEITEFWSSCLALQPETATTDNDHTGVRNQKEGEAAPEPCAR